MESQLAANIKIKLSSITKAAIITFVCYRGYCVPFQGGGGQSGRGVAFTTHSNLVPRLVTDVPKDHTDFMIIGPRTSDCAEDINILPTDTA